MKNGKKATTKSKKKVIKSTKNLTTQKVNKKQKVVFQLPFVKWS